MSDGFVLYGLANHLTRTGSGDLDLGLTVLNPQVTIGSAKFGPTVGPGFQDSQFTAGLSSIGHSIVSFGHRLQSSSEAEIVGRFFQRPSASAFPFSLSCILDSTFLVRHQ